MSWKSEVMMLFRLISEKSSFILGLSPQDEQMEDKLNELFNQKEQAILRIDHIKQLNSITEWPDEVKVEIGKCIIVEKEVEAKLIKIKESISEDLGKINQGRLIRQNYSQNTYASSGVFFDRQN